VVKVVPSNGSARAAEGTEKSLKAIVGMLLDIHQAREP
jgi:hypothetical protein